VSRWESGEQPCKAREIRALASVLGVTADELLTSSWATMTIEALQSTISGMLRERHTMVNAARRLVEERNHAKQLIVDLDGHPEAESLSWQEAGRIYVESDPLELVQRIIEEKNRGQS
jgi:hypothetical protein